MANDCETDNHRRNGISRREELGYHRALPLSPSDGTSCRSVQSAKHVEQLDGVRRRWRDWKGTGRTSGSVRSVAHHRYESHTPEAYRRAGQSGRPEWQTLEKLKSRRVL